MKRLHALAGLLAASTLATAQNQLELKPCRLEHPARVHSLPAQCGTLSVAEDPSKPDGRRIDLYVARVPAISLNKAPDPLFLIAGGPGTSAVDLYTSSSLPFDRVRRTRDIILVDQRGTGRSQRLDCDYGDRDLFQSVDEIKVGADNIRCRDELSKTADLSQYTTSVAVRDLDAVRAALGYQRINLYGNSYGTRVAQHYARRFPDATRTVILDGVIDPVTILGPGIAPDAEAALARILARCTADPICAKAFPDPMADYRALRTRLAATPVKATIGETATGRPMSFDFTARHLSAVLRFASYSDVQAALLPLSLHLASREDNLTPLANQFRVFAGTLQSAFAYGMHNSVACSEDTPFIDTSTLDRASLAETHMGADQVDQLLKACADWPKGVVDADLHEPLKSDAAALLLSGADDPVTPPKYAELAKKGFADSAHVIVPAHGHGQLGAPCVDRIMAQFIDAGTAKALDTKCTGKLAPMPFFTTLAGPSP
jgi:pimeloyl-ACP methyl ester carboxylesterase